jgi:hypothetical protein
VHDQYTDEHMFESTTFGWKYVKLSRPPEANRQREAPSRGFRRLPRWPMRKPLALTMKFRGGAECWIEVHSRGQIARFPGNTALYDVFRRIANNDA